MKILSKKPVFTAVFILTTLLGFSQSNEIKVRFIGNCALHMTDGNLNVYFDFPYKSGAFNYMEYDRSEVDSIADNAIFLFTHRHPDHYSKKLVRKLNGKVHGPWKVAKKRRLDLEQLSDSLKFFSVESFKTSHKLSFHHSSYLITWHGKKIFISGDTGDTGPISKISGVDWVFAPFWIYQNAAAEDIHIDSKMLGIYHLYPDQKIDGEVPERFLLLKEQGAAISIPY